MAFVQGVLIWSGFFYEAINDRNMQVIFNLKLVLECWDLEILENIKLIFKLNGSRDITGFDWKSCNSKLIITV